MNLDPRMQKKIDESNKRGGIDLKKLAVGTKIQAKTLNSLYEIEVWTDNQYLIKGGTRFQTLETVWITGSTWGGSMIKQSWLGIDMSMEIWRSNQPLESRCVTTTPVTGLKIISPKGDWEYEL